MAKRRRRTEAEEAAAVVQGFFSIVDTLFVQFTGRTAREIFTEAIRQPRELPPGRAAPPTSDDMSLEHAYTILGLKSEASLDDVKKSHRNLARFFHTDKGNAMNDEAMKLLNRAYDRITKQR
jgi:DnaJ-class molecular chaperone